MPWPHGAHLSPRNEEHQGMYKCVENGRGQSLPLGLATSTTVLI
jgi:hypothetical protein